QVRVFCCLEHVFLRHKNRSDQGVWSFIARSKECTENAPKTQPLFRGSKLERTPLVVGLSLNQTHILGFSYHPYRLQQPTVLRPKKQMKLRSGFVRRRGARREPVILWLVCLAYGFYCVDASVCGSYFPRQTICETTWKLQSFYQALNISGIPQPVFGGKERR